MSESPLRILVVVAHPHDFTHCAATCGIHAARGDSVTVVTVTSGARTHNERLHDELLKPEAERDPSVLDQRPEEYARIKAGEVRRVCALFGVTDVRILQWPQPFRLESSPGAVDELRQVFSRRAPPRPDHPEALLQRAPRHGQHGPRRPR